MSPLQLSFNFKDVSPLEEQLLEMKREIEKTRKKLFAELGELKKEVQRLKDENTILRGEPILFQPWPGNPIGSSYIRGTP